MAGTGDAAGGRGTAPARPGAPRHRGTVPGRTAGLILLVAVVVLLSRCSAFTPLAHRPAPGSPGRAQIQELLARVAVVPARTHAPGYERGCAAGEGCVFGAAWSDDTDAPLAHNGCGTRDDVLARAMTDVRVRPGTRGCVVVAGTLADPYTGRRIAFRKADAAAVQIDHVIPLAAAWDLGAHAWPQRLRARFANDVDVELLAVDGPANQRKSDGTPEQWVPEEPAYRCFYAAKYLTAAVRYALPVTEGDRRVLAGIAQGCG